MNYNWQNCFCDPTAELPARVASIVKSDKQFPMLCYVIMMYDPRTPLRKTIPDLAERKAVASKLSGYSIEFQEEDIYDEDKQIYVTKVNPNKNELSNDGLIDCIQAYLKIASPRRYATLVAIEQSIWEMQRRLFMPIAEVGGGEDKDMMAAINMKPTTANNLVEMNKLLESLETEFYGGDEVADIIKPKKFTPEGVAKKKR